MIKPSIEQILMLHTQLIEQTGGSNGVRDYNLLESAVETPFQSFGGKELYPTIQAKAVRLGYGLIKNHPMIDGNKRIGAHAMLVFLALKLSHTLLISGNCCKISINFSFAGSSLMPPALTVRQTMISPV